MRLISTPRASSEFGIRIKGNFGAGVKIQEPEHLSVDLTLITLALSPKH